MFFRGRTINFDISFSTDFIRTKLDPNHFLYSNIKISMFFRGKTKIFDYFFSCNLIRTKLDPNHFYILLECKSKKMKIAILELKNPYEQIFVRHPIGMRSWYIVQNCREILSQIGYFVEKEKEKAT